MLTAQQWGLCIGQKILVKSEFCPDIQARVIGLCHEFMGSKGIKIICERTIIYESEKCKPILRTLDQMTEEERKELSEMMFGEEAIISTFTKDGIQCKIGKEWGHYRFRTTETDWLTAKGFDIRGWIDAGLAIKEES